MESEPHVPYRADSQCFRRFKGEVRRLIIVVVKTTAYFDLVRQRADRRIIKDEWIERAIRSPLRRVTQSDGRIKLWVRIPEMENRCMRVILLEDGVTVHNAFLDRRFPS
jgi:hypothetical protein